MKLAFILLLFVYLRCSQAAPGRLVASEEIPTQPILRYVRSPVEASVEKDLEGSETAYGGYYYYPHYWYHHYPYYVVGK